MISSDDLTLISYLAKGKSIAAAARELYLTPSAVSQRLTILEDKLGLELAMRNGRSGIVLTSDGEFLADRAVNLLSELQLIQDQVNERKGTVSGNISITAPYGFGRHYIAPAIATLCRKYPDLSIDLELSADLSRVPHNSWDIIIRVSPIVDSNFTSMMLAANRRLICASPEYIEQHGSLRHPEDIRQHQCIAINEDGNAGAYWSFTSDQGQSTTIKIKPKFITNDGETALNWAIGGMGLLVRSEWSALPAIAEKKLIELLPGWDAPAAPVVAITSRQGADSLRVQAVLDHLVKTIEIC